MGGKRMVAKNARFSSLPTNFFWTSAPWQTPEHTSYCHLINLLIHFSRVHIINIIQAFFLRRKNLTLLPSTHRSLYGSVWIEHEQYRPLYRKVFAAAVTSHHSYPHHGQQWPRHWRFLHHPTISLRNAQAIEGPVCNESIMGRIAYPTRFPKNYQTKIEEVANDNDCSTPPDTINPVAWELVYPYSYKTGKSFSCLCKVHPSLRLGPT